MANTAETQSIAIVPEDALKVDYSLDKIYALQNLIFVSEENPLVRNEELYQRFLKDYRQAQKEYDEAWDFIVDKYNISRLEGYELHLDFNKNEITYISA